MTLYPTRYGRRLVTLEELRNEHSYDKMHPAYRDRLFAWIEAQDGKIGIGGSWREDGSQPDKPGFAPEGKSFHQYQQFASGLIAFCAVDLVARNGSNVHRAPRWDEVPAQDTAAAELWGVHCNVRTEPWHMQPVEIDGWKSWKDAGSPDPKGTDMLVPLVVPRRVYDSRNASAGRLAPNQPRQVLVGRDQVFVHVTVVDPDGSGFVSVCGNSQPTATSLVNYQTGQVNSSGAPVQTVDGRIRVTSSQACHIIVDIYAESPT